MIHLQAEEKPWRNSERLPQQNRGSGRNGALPAHDLGDGHGAAPHLPSKIADRESEGHKELIAQYVARCISSRSKWDVDFCFHAQW